MTGPLTLKQRFREENFDPTNFQKLQFPDNISNYCKISIVYSLSSTNYHHKRQTFQLYCCRVNLPVKKTYHCRSWSLFITKTANTSDQSNKRKFQQS